MLYLDIQKFKEAEKAAKIQKYIGGASSYMKIIMKFKEGCVQRFLVVTFF